MEDWMVFNSDDMPDRYLSVRKVICNNIRYVDFSEILYRSKRDMALLIAEKILEGETFFSIREVAKENVTEINGSCVVLMLEEYEKNMRDQFKRGLDCGNGMMPARILK